MASTPPPPYCSCQQCPSPSRLVFRLFSLPLILKFGLLASPPHSFQRSNLRICQHLAIYPLSFDTLMNSFVYLKKPTRLFSINSELFCKNTRVGVSLSLKLRARTHTQREALWIMHASRGENRQESRRAEKVRPSSTGYGRLKAIPRSRGSRSRRYHHRLRRLSVAFRGLRG